MILSFVMTHKDCKDTAQRHINIWTKIGRVIFVSPEDAPMGIGNNELLIGKAEHHGELSAQRIIKILEESLKYKYDHLLLLEYDAIALDIPEDCYPDEEGLSAAVYSQNKHDKFSGSFYIHYPILFTRRAVERILDYLPLIHTEDRYYSDRFLGMAAELSGLPVKDLMKSHRAYSRNTIREKNYPALLRQLRLGAVFFHGVKTVKVLNKILRNRK